MKISNQKGFAVLAVVALTMVASAAFLYLTTPGHKVAANVVKSDTTIKL